MPLALVAVTVNVYAIPFVKPVTTIGEDDPVAVIFPGEEVTVYVVDCPHVAPAVKLTEHSPLLPDTEPIVGACGTVVAVTALDAELAEDDEYELAADTVYVYCVDEARPVAIIGLDVPVNVAGDVVGLGVTVNTVSGPPNSDLVNATEALPLLYDLPVPWSVAVTEVGTPGVTGD